MNLLQEGIVYEVEIEALTLSLRSGKQFEFPDMLANGRANYILFEELIRALTGLKKTKQSDHTSATGLKFEQKAFFDKDLYPLEKYDLFQTSASSTFGANNDGPIIAKYLAESKYERALQVCKETGYDKNDFYIYTNTRGFSPSVPLRYVIVSKPTVLLNLSLKDPRLISRESVLKTTKQVQAVT